MDGFSYFDLIIGAIVILLGLKGLIDGFIKEAFGLVGIIGGIYVGSHYGQNIGEFINQNIFQIKNPAALTFVGFLVTLTAFWLAMLLLGKLFAKLSSASGIGPIDKIAGFLFGAAKVFLILSVIVFAVSNIEAAKNIVDKYTKNSLLFPLMEKTGSYIIKLNPKEITQKVEEKTAEVQEDIKKSIENETIKQIKDKIEQTFENNETKKQ